MVQLDIPMPKTCYECPCHDGENNSCQVTGKYYYGEILRSCPLIELPSAQPELKELSEWKADFKGYINDLNMPKDDYDGIMEYIDEVPSAQPEQRWIPCSERQPDKEDDYLVTLLDDGRTWVEIALWNETFGGSWQAVLYNDVDYSNISNVIAWKPLPEPYQEGGEADE